MCVVQVASEFFKSIGNSKPEKVKIIVSSHNYEFTPSTEELGNLVAKIQATGADIVKIATTALDITDSARVFQILANSQVPFATLLSTFSVLLLFVVCIHFNSTQKVLFDEQER